MQFVKNIDLLQFRIEALVKYNYWNRTLGLARSLLALGLLITLVFNSNEVLFSFGMENDMVPKFNKYNFYSIYNVMGSIALGKYVSIAILILVISGIYPRVTCLFHWWVSFSYFSTSFVIDGGDQINSILTLFLIPICLLDSRKSHWKNSPTELHYNYIKNIIAFFAFLFIELQIGVLYFHSVIGKLAVREWVNGTALYYWFSNQIIGMNEALYPLIMPLLEHPVSLTFLTWGVILFEMFLFSCIFIKSKRIRKIAWISGLCFHFGIILIHGLVSFFFAMAGALTLYLVTKKKVISSEDKQYVE